MRLKVDWVVENGYPHCKITVVDTGMEVHCDENEINETIAELVEGV